MSSYSVSSLCVCLFYVYFTFKKRLLCEAINNIFKYQSKHDMFLLDHSLELTNSFYIKRKILKNTKILHINEGILIKKFT
jgi:hypothetical protein